MEREGGREKDQFIHIRTHSHTHILHTMSFIIVFLQCRDIYTAVKESSAQEVELGDDGSWRPVISKSL